MTENELGKIIVDSAIAVHRELGPGLLETVYEVILAHELSLRGLSVERQMPISVCYKRSDFRCGIPGRLSHRAESDSRVKVRRTGQPSSQKTSSNLSALNRMQAWFRIKFWRGSHEAWNHARSEWSGGRLINTVSNWSQINSDHEE
jgi:hypothetical protein